MSTIFPENISEREDYILKKIKDGQYEIKWSKIVSKYKGHEGIFFVTSDALKIDGIRINVSAKLQQQIADLTASSLLTAKLADLIYQQANIILKPKPRPISSSVKAMIEHSKDIDNELNKLTNKDGLISTVGKHWLIDNLLATKKEGTSLNYGWHFKDNFAGIKGELPVMYKEMPGVKVIQGVGTRHFISHSDYSQTCSLVARECEINGKSVDILDLFKEPELSYLINHNGILNVLRQPGIIDSKISVIIP